MTVCRRKRFFWYEGGCQVARFVHELVAERIMFKGSLIFEEAKGSSFDVVALLQDRNMFSAVPVIPEKSPVVR